MVQNLNQQKHLCLTRLLAQISRTADSYLLGSMATMQIQWISRYFPSGTTIVARKDGAQPHFYIYGPGGETESDSDRNRYKVCEEIRDYLNGGERPKWLDDLERVSEIHAKALDGTSITATGPSIDANPPRCQWVSDESEEAQNARARLMDRLFLESAA